MALQMNSGGPFEVGAMASSRQSAIAARDRCSGFVMVIWSPLQRKIDNFMGRSLPFHLISFKTQSTIVESLISGDFHHFLADSWANRILSFLEGMSQAGDLPGPPSGSQVRGEAQTLAQAASQGFQGSGA
ncbi:hypothetical protein HAX54_004054 [Datura stramonium]|uniref:Uncharacterized protein n=1 Tax=Datura stramonium TaxID=4076 RepID=A0ABS8WXH3_DATST|nr:hypothetical protein [Datura stramonium]